MAPSTPKKQKSLDRDQINKVKTLRRLDWTYKAIASYYNFNTGSIYYVLDCVYTTGFYALFG